MPRSYRISLAAAALAALVAAPAAVSAQAEQKVEVELSSFAFTPATIALAHGRPYVLELTNTSGGGHNFSAPAFFAAARIAPADRAKIGKKGIEVGGGETVAIHFTAPAAGRYKLRCTHFLHSSFGMNGEIVVT